MQFLKLSWIFPRENAHCGIARVFESRVKFFDLDRHWKNPI